MQSFFKILKSGLLILMLVGFGIGQLQAKEPSKAGNTSTKEANKALETSTKDAHKTGDATNKESNKSAESEKAKMGQFCWTELATANVQSAKDFYSKAFGWKFKDNVVGDMTYTMVSINDKDFAGIWTIPKDQQSQIPPHWLAYILVDNLEQSLDKATKNGATVIRPITQAGEHGRLAIIKDPTGAQVALWQNLKK